MAITTLHIVVMQGQNGTKGLSSPTGRGTMKWWLHWEIQGFQRLIWHWFQREWLKMSSQLGYNLHVLTNAADYSFFRSSWYYCWVIFSSPFFQFRTFKTPRVLQYKISNITNIWGYEQSESSDSGEQSKRLLTRWGKNIQRQKIHRITEFIENTWLENKYTGSSP